jgi:hypothetical protein
MHSEMLFQGLMRRPGLGSSTCEENAKTFKQNLNRRERDPYKDGKEKKEKKP